MPEDRKYVKDKTNGRYYGDFRDLNNRCEALIDKDNGAKSATTDKDVADKLIVKRVKELEDEKRGIAIVGGGREETLNDYALHHLKKKKASKGEQRQLERAVEFFGKKKTLSAIGVTDIEDWVEDLREPSSLRSRRSWSALVRWKECGRQRIVFSGSSVHSARCRRALMQTSSA